MNILDKIILNKKEEVSALKKSVSIEELKNRSGFDKEPISLKDNLLNKSDFGIISEFKRQSPSKGIINNMADVIETTKGYQSVGASGISILTDTTFFGGKTEDLLKARPFLDVPILRKDFIIDEYQVYETKAMGADVMLLIASVLSSSKQQVLASLAKELGLEVLLEIHSEEELVDDMVPLADILGVNNRNLKTFETSIQNSIDMLAVLPHDVLKISESGISSLEDINKLVKHGFKGFLIGEQFMKSQEPAEELRKFLKPSK
jgi:indole-3-glycerol phosphate synthase